MRAVRRVARRDVVDALVGEGCAPSEGIGGGVPGAQRVELERQSLELSSVRERVAALESRAKAIVFWAWAFIQSGLMHVFFMNSVGVLLIL